MNRVTLRVVAVLISFAAYADDPAAISTVEPASRRVIVELVRQSAEPARGTLARFNRDLTRIDRAVAASTSSGPVRRAAIAREYSVVFFGAAVDATPQTVRALESLSYVRRVHRDMPVNALALPKREPVVLADPVNARARVGATDLPTLGDGIRVAVIDTGIDYTHPALGGGLGAGFKVAGGRDFVNGDNDPFDDNGHGTHVSGIIAADSELLTGVAPHVTLYGFKVLNQYGGGWESDIVAGIEAAADPNGDGDPADHVDVANISLGGGGNADDPQSRAVDAAVAAGVVMCVAAGNAGGFAVVLSPGTARDAITVAAIKDDGSMTDFSSRGPTPSQLAFKPDIAAPGYQIVSSVPGGRTESFNGTSMASPHVAGVAALVKALHPDWDPLRIKQALISSATPLNGTGHERGAGRVDAGRATRATLLLDRAGLSFGLDTAADGSFTGRDTFRITNHSNAPMQLTASEVNAQKGVAITVTPSVLSIAPGATVTAEVSLRVENAEVPFGAAKLVGGEIALSGASDPIRIPWLVVRAARCTLTYDMLSLVPRATAGSTTAWFMIYAADRAELFVPPGTTWEIFFGGTDPEDQGVFRMLTVPGQEISGDREIVKSRADAPYRISFDARDDDGKILREIPVSDVTRHSVFLRLERPAAPGNYIILGGITTALYVSKLPYKVVVLEELFDLERMRFFNVRHQPVDATAIDGPVTVSTSAADYRHGRVRITPGEAKVCATLLSKGGGLTQWFITSCVTRGAGPEVIDYYATPDAETNEHVFGLEVSTPAIEAPPLRAVDGGMYVTSDATPGPLAYALSSTTPVQLGIGPLHPISLLRAFKADRTGPFGDPSTATIAGALGENRPALIDGIRWEIFKDETRMATGRLPQTIDAALLIPPYRIHAQRDGILVDGHHGAFEADITVKTLGTLQGLVPSIGSMRVLDAAGNATERVANGEAAALHFTAFDLTDGRVTYSPPHTEATTVAYRAHGTGAWISLPVVVEQTEIGRASSLGHTPSGDVYRVDLRDVTRGHANALIDLQVTVSDASGNRLVWTQSPAFAVGTVPVGPRRRAVR